MHLEDGFFLAPSFLFSPLPTVTQDAAASKSFLALVGNIGKRWVGFDFNFGTGLLLEAMQGAGGTIVLDNGNSRSTFALPGGVSISRSMLLKASLGYEVPVFPLRFEATWWGHGVLSKSRVNDFLFTFIYLKVSAYL